MLINQTLLLGTVLSKDLVL